MGTLNRKISSALVWHLGGRADGQTEALNRLRIRPGESLAAAFDIASRTYRRLFDADFGSIVDLV